MPRIPLTLISKSAKLEVVALVDSGSMVNVLPMQVGVDLGLQWDDAKATLQLGGVLSANKAVAVTAQAVIGDFEPCVLSFAWTRAKLPAVILGQVNFFNEFEVTFRRWLLEFEVVPRPK